MIDDPHSVALELLAYCRSNDWAGYDPYDALNSGLFRSWPALDSRIPRLILTQALKRSPVNLRPLLRIPRTQNPKGLGLFLSSVIRLDRLGLPGGEALAESLAEKILAIRSSGTDAWCWGYSFPWQTRTIVVPRGAPNAVCTTFVADALLDWYEHSRDGRYLQTGMSAADYLVGLIWSKGNVTASLSYPAASQSTEIHNANLLGAAFLCRVSKLTGESRWLEPAYRLARYSAARQRDDGSWPYGELPTQMWIDNFHTGYNLCALRAIGRHTDTLEFEPCVERGYSFYRRHFFRNDAAPRYFHDRTYPIDAHCVAQSIITLVELKDLDKPADQLLDRVYRWAMEHLWNSQGYFYYRALPWCRIRTPYMRWVEAWMLLALCRLAESRAPAVESASRTVTAGAKA